ncbi:MAG: hypothetical protein JST30_12695 [Armatimonadetes bacterium]|nr:hypothetical protein [Armatimonadota bacterium]
MPRPTTAVPLTLASMALIATACLIVAARPVRAQIAVVPPFVQVQQTTPGTPQSGHSNVTGTAIAGQFKGGGAGLTNVNADLLDGLNSTAFLQAVPNPLNVSGVSSSQAVIKGANGSTALGSSGVSGEASAATGSVYGVYGTSPSTSGRGVFGWASAATGTTYGGRFESESSSGRGIYALAGSSTGTTYGGRFQSSSTSGFGAEGTATASTGSTVGVKGTAASTTGIGVQGEATAVTGATIGVSGIVDSPSGAAVFGSSLATSGVSFGVRGVADSSSARALSGWATSTTGNSFGAIAQSDSSTGKGLYGSGFSTTGVNYGVYGKSWSPNGISIYAEGDFGASGTKAFRIDHPADPAHRYLFHYSTESPMPQNFYVGNVVTGADGYAWVELPSYFADINANFKYQLTVVDDADADGFVLAKVSKEIRGNRFQIRTSAPRTKVSWRVDADRNDPYVRHRRPKTEVQKVGPENGTYQHPELYGQPAEKGVSYDVALRSEGVRKTGRP